MVCTFMVLHLLTLHILLSGNTSDGGTDLVCPRL